MSWCLPLILQSLQPHRLPKRVKKGLKAKKEVKTKEEVKGNPPNRPEKLATQGGEVRSIDISDDRRSCFAPKISQLTQTR
jgi:hypothetical protein